MMLAERHVARSHSLLSDFAGSELEPERGDVDDVTMPNVHTPKRQELTWMVLLDDVLVQLHIQFGNRRRWKLKNWVIMN